MQKNVLYFPYIRVPQSSWFTRMLLYWDRVGAIVPYDFIQAPERLGEHMRRLVEYRLVHQVVPGMYVGGIPRFRDAFGEHLESLGTEVDTRRDRFQQEGGISIHIEKMDDIATVLHDYGLARLRGYPWFEVERETAHDFMSYLASVLGQLEDVAAMPITDTHAYLQRFRESGVAANNLDQQLSTLRLQVLEQVLPSPERPLDPADIDKFKARHGDNLARFRRTVERELLAVADIDNQDLRDRRLELFYEEVQEQVDELRARMQESGFGSVLLTSLCSLVTAIPGAPPVFGLAKAVYQAFKGAGRDEAGSGSGDLAYAAYAQVELA